MVGKSSIIANAAGFARDRLARAFPWFYGASTKHHFARDYGWPEELTFQQLYDLYCRYSLATAAVDKTIAKTWQTMPELWESEKPGKSAAEATIAKHFAKRKIWRSLMDADRRSMVGSYSGAIILLRDGKQLAEPVDRVPRGIESLAGIIPAWEGQLTPLEYDQDQTSETYGEPLYFQYDEQAVGDPKAVGKSQIRIHRDRILIWSDDGTINCRSALEPGFNDVSDAAKIKGAGAEGFWKSARGAPIIEAPTGVSPEDVRSGLGATTNADAIDKLNEQVDQFQAGFDKALMLGSFSAKPLTITLPQPKEFWETAVQSFAASVSMPVKILIGNVTGERASTEDANEWAQTNMSRRTNRVIPLLDDLIGRLVRWGALDSKPWAIGWTSLLESSPDDKLARAEKMANINSQQNAIGEPVFLPDEIREEAGYQPGEEVDGFAEWQRERAAQRQQQAEGYPDRNHASRGAGMTKQVRVNVSTLVNASKIRREKRDGREVVIVPSATLPDNVVMNGKGNGPSRGAIMYPAEEIEKAWRALEGSPAPLGHPVVNGKFVLARSPEGLARSYVGAHNENVRRENGRVLLDKVIDVQVANQSQGGRDLLAAIDKQEPIHTSTGVMAMLEEAPAGAGHNYVARNLMLEHDAILLNEAGAAGPEQGVGIFVNAAGDEIEVINSALDDEIDRDLDWSIDNMLRAVERKERQPLIERIKSFITELVQGGPTPDPTKGVALNAEDEVMDKAGFDALLAKVDAIANAQQQPGLTEEKVGEIVANALKPIIDAQAARDAADKAKADGEHAALVNQVVEAELLTEELAKASPAPVLTALLANASAPKTAFRVNGAFKPQGDKPGFTAPKGE